MKKLSVLITAALFACHVHAQTSKGTVALTATFGYTQYKGSADKELNGILYNSEGRNYTVAPSIGVFVKDNLELGASAYLNENEVESLAPSVNYVSNYNLKSKDKFFGLYARHYKYLKGKLAAYATLSGGLRSRGFELVSAYTYLADTNHTYSDVKEDHYTTFSVGLSPGLSFFASKKIALNMNLGALRYSRHKVDENYISKDTRYSPSGYEFDYDSNILEFDFSSINMNLGLTYFIGK